MKCFPSGILSFFLSCLAVVSAAAQTTVSFQAPEASTPGFDGTWLDGFGGGNTLYGPNNQLRAGRSGSSDSGVARGLVRWDIRALLGKYTAVTAISAEFTVAGASAASAGGILELYALPTADAGWSGARSTKNLIDANLNYPWSGTADSLGFQAVPSGSLLGSVTYAANPPAGTKLTVNFTGNSAALTALLDDLVEGRCGGFLLKAANETTPSSDVWLASSGNATLANRPKLTVTYTPGFRAMDASGSVNSDAYLARFRAAHGVTWDTSVSPNRIKEGDGTYEMDRNARYALALLETGLAANVAPAESLISYIRTQQFLDGASDAVDGHIRYKNTTASVAASNPVLHDFCTFSLLAIRLQHYGRLSGTAQGILDATLQSAVKWTRNNRGFGVLGITNQETVAWSNMMLGGQIYNNADWRDTGAFFWGQSWTEWFTKDGGAPNVVEFVSPTYGMVTAENLHQLIRHLTSNATVLAQARQLDLWLWSQLAEFYHQPSRMFAGPFSRSYSDYNGNWTDQAVNAILPGLRNGVESLPHKETFPPYAPRCAPAVIAPFVKPLPAARQVTDTFFAGPTSPSTSDIVSHHISCHGVVPIIGTTYLHPSFALGSLNFGKSGYYLAGVKRPLLLHFGNGTLNSAYTIAFQTLVNEGSGLKETSRPLVFTKQKANSPDTLIGVTWSNNVNYDFPVSSTPVFTASDLRIRWQVTRYAGTPPAFNLPANLTDPASVTINGVTTTFKLLHQEFTGFTPYWAASTGVNAAYLDLVIYSGASRSFDLAAVNRFTAAFALTASTSGAQSPVVTTSVNPTSTDLVWGSAYLSYPTKPGETSALARQFRDLSAATPLGSPLAFTITSATGSQLNLSWTDTANAETGFQLERATGSGGFAPLATLVANTTTYADTTVAPATHYRYRLRAIDTSSQGAWSAEVARITPGTFATPVSLFSAQPPNTTRDSAVQLLNPAPSSQSLSPAIPGGNGAYTVVNSSASYAWIDISTTGTRVDTWNTSINGDRPLETGLAYNNGTYDIPIGFPFPFYGQSKSNLRIEVGGRIRFASDATFGAPAALQMDTTAYGNDLIAVFNSGYYADSKTRVFYRQVDANTFVVQWDNIRLTSPASIRATFQAVLKRDGRILVNIRHNDLNGSNAGGQYSIGIKNADNTSRLQAVYARRDINPGSPTYNQNIISGALPTYVPVGNNVNHAYTFSPPVNWLQPVTAAPFALSASASGAYTFRFDSAGLTAGTTKTLDVQVDSSLEAQPSYLLPATLLVTTELPGTVATPTSPSTTTSSATLQWSDLGLIENGYQIERKTGSGGTFELIADLAHDTTSFTDTGLTAGATYYYRIRGYNGNGFAPYSTELSVTLPADLPPAAPTNLVVASATSSTELSLSWSDNSAIETGFQLERSPNGSSGWTLLASLAANTTTHLDTGLTPATAYFYRVRATNAVGASPPSNTATGTTLAAPTSLTKTVRNGENSYSGMQGRATSSFGGGTTVSDQYIASLGGQGRFITPIRVNNLNISDLLSVEAVRFSVKVASNSLNGSGTLALVFNNRGTNSGWVETAVTQISLNGSSGWAGPSGTLSQAGSGVAPFASSGAWDLGSGGVNNAMPILATAVVDNTTATNATITFTMSGLSPDERLELITLFNHSYGTGANTNYGQSYSSNPGFFLSFSATSTYTTGDIRFYGDNDPTVANRPQFSVDYTISPAEPAPTPPSNLTVAAVTSSTQLTLQWTDASSNETGFQLERSLDGSTGWTPVATPASNTTIYVDSGLLAGVAYYYRIRSVNTGGASAFSATAFGTTWSSTEAWFNEHGLPTNTSLAEDTDNDGVSNLLEFALGGDPLSLSIAPRPRLDVDSNHLTLSFPLERGELTYIVEGSSDLVTWTPISFTPVAAGETQVVTDSADLSVTPRRFLRLRIALP